MMHLTEERLRALLDGKLPPDEARALADHLARDCAECEALLAAAPAGALDGAIDAALTALAPVRLEEAGTDLEYARIRRRVRAAAGGRRPWLRPLAIAAAVAVAAGVTLKVLVDREARDARWDGEKGIGSSRAAAVPVRLSAVAVLGEPGAEPRLVKVAHGEALPPAAALQLRVEVGRAADVALARVGPGGDVDVFWRERVAHAGPVQLSVEGRPAAYPLAGLTGPQRFVAIASARGLDEGRAAAAARTIAAAPSAAAERAASGEGITFDILEVTVR